MKSVSFILINIIYLIGLAGLPTTIVFSLTSFVTTAPAPIIAFSPMLTPGKSEALLPTFAPYFNIGPCSATFPFPIYLSFDDEKHGPIKTLFSTFIFSLIYDFVWTVIHFPLVI